MKQYKSAAAILMMSAVFLGIHSQPSQAEKTTEKETVTNKEQQDFKTLMDRFSYAYGADLAEKFKDEGITLNVTLLADAMQSAFNNDEMKMSADEVIATLDLYKQIHTKKKEAEWTALSEKNKKEGEAFLAENAKKEGVLVTESGLQYKIISKGDGGYKPKEDDEVIVSYRGTFIDGTEFDSTHKRNQPYNAKVKQLIQGWSEALQMMTKGAKWELYIPSDIAYGEEGSDPHIGPNAVLKFEVELIDIEKYKAP